MAAKDGKQLLGPNKEHRRSSRAASQSRHSFSVGEEVEFYRESSDRWYQATVLQVLAQGKYQISICRRGKDYKRNVSSRHLAKLETHVKLCRLGREIEYKLPSNGDGDDAAAVWVQGVVVEGVSDNEEFITKVKGGRGGDVEVVIQFMHPVTGVMVEEKVLRKKITKFGTHLTPDDEKLDGDAKDEFQHHLPIAVSGEIDEPNSAFDEFTPNPPLPVDALEPLSADAQVPPEYQLVEKIEAGELDEADANAGSLDPSPALSPMDLKSKGQLNRLDLTVGDVIELQRPSRDWVQATVNRLGKRNMIVEFIENSVLCRRKVPVSSPFVAKLGTHTEVEEEVGERVITDYKVADHVEILRPNGKWCEAVIARLGKRNALVEFLESGKMQRRKFALNSNALAPLGSHLHLADFGSLSAASESHGQAWEFKIGDHVEFCDLSNIWKTGIVRKKGKENIVIEYMSGQAKAFKKISKSSRFLCPAGYRNPVAASAAPSSISSSKGVVEEEKIAPKKVELGSVFVFSVDEQKFSGKIVAIGASEISVEVDGGGARQTIHAPAVPDMARLTELLADRLVDQEEDELNGRQFDYDVPPDSNDMVLDDNSLPPPSYDD
eukprot:TRINITY_DN8251_c0_g1_i1.p1 TRINITY_DN8251_c0_g1~~TRINITY_DN8251_c0_g1_i1.p1  ORF type:complete len:649 (-),score=168.58 TRINITY_DN8251_c0_g1_i1:99-1919(-)